MKCALMLSLICLPVHAWFEHGRAVEAANNGDWQRASSLLTTELINHSDDPCVIYDAAVAAYKVGDHEQARVYFEHVKDFPHASYNLGNAYVALKKLEDAIKSYEYALRIDPQDERARHNLEIVKKMLEQQKQEQEKQQEDKQEQDKENKKEKEKQDQKGGQEQQQDESSAESGGDSERDEQESEGAQERDSKRDASDKKEKEREQKNQETKKQQADKNDSRPYPSSSSGRTDQSGTDVAANKKSEENKKEAAAQQSAVKVDKQLLRLLEQQEKHDAQVNKQMIKATLGGQGDKHDKNCW